MCELNHCGESFCEESEDVQECLCDDVGGQACTGTRFSIAG